MHRSLVIDALEMGLFQRRPPKGKMIFHSDRGSQYASDDSRQVLDQHGVQPSMSRKGNCWDNAVTETLFGSLKVERLHGERFLTIRQAKDAVLSWLLWYNRQRVHSTLNYLSPVEFESHWETNLHWLLHEKCGNRTRRRKCRLVESVENHKTVSHPSHQPWKSIKPISTFPPSRPLRRDELIS
jgi:hypothetical protein